MTTEQRIREARPSWAKILKWIERTAAALHARLELWGELTRRILGVWG